MRAASLVWATLAGATGLGCGSDDASAESQDAAPAEDGGAGLADTGPDASPVDATVCPIVGFEPCGGDVAGSWRVRELCPEDEAAAQALCESPFSDRAQCVGGTNTQRCRFLRDTTFDFGDDGVLRIRGRTRIEARYHFDDACLAATGTEPTPAERCAALDGERLDCTPSAGGCDCAAVTDPEPADSDVPFAVEGTTLVFGSGAERSTGSYCVMGDRLVADVTPHPISWRYWVLER